MWAKWNFSAKYLATRRQNGLVCGTASGSSGLGGGRRWRRRALARLLLGKVPAHLAQLVDFALDRKVGAYTGGAATAQLMGQGRILEEGQNAAGQGVLVPR